MSQVLLEPDFSVEGASAVDPNIGFPTTASEAIWLEVRSSFRFSIEDELADDEERDCFADFSDFEYAENSELGYPIDSAMARGSEDVNDSRVGFATGADFGFVGLIVLFCGGRTSAIEGAGGAETDTESFTGIISWAGSIFFIGLAGSGAVR